MILITLFLKQLLQHLYLLRCKILSKHCWLCWLFRLWRLWRLWRLLCLIKLLLHLLHFDHHLIVSLILQLIFFLQSEYLLLQFRWVHWIFKCLQASFFLFLLLVLINHLSDLNVSGRSLLWWSVWITVFAVML